MTAEHGHEQAEPANKHERKWALPKRLFGRARTSTVILSVAFVATAMLHDHFNPEPPTSTTPVPTEPISVIEVTPTPPPSRSTVTTPPAATTTATTTPPVGSSVASSPTPKPLIVLPPGIAIPSGIELPPGVVTATPATPTTPPTPTP